MAILDKLKSVGGAIKDKVGETFGDGRAAVDDDELGSEPSVEPTPALDLEGARRALDIDERANLAEVREAYRKLARELYPRARKEGADSAAQGVLDRALQALELLEQELLPLGGAAAGPSSAAAASGSKPTATSKRKRATPRNP